MLRQGIDVAEVDMCHDCDCRDMPLLRDYVAEHERAVNLGGAAVQALDRGDGETVPAS